MLEWLSFIRIMMAIFFIDNQKSHARSNQAENQTNIVVLITKISFIKSTHKNKTSTCYIGRGLYKKTSTITSRGHQPSSPR